MPTAPDTDPVALGREVIRACLGLGFAAAGIARAEPSSRASELRDWLAAGKHGTMAWMEEYLDHRTDVTKLLPGARAVIVVADAYAARDSDSSPVQQSNHASGSIARYARGEDYHSVIKRRLKRLADRLRRLHTAAAFRSFVDTGPAMEREHAARAGLGWIGKHTLLIDPARGSWFVLGGIATTLDLAPDAAPIADHCGTCTRCIDACPTNAITPYSVDATRCISYLTIEHDGPIDPSLHAGIGDRLIGCDVCQEVCPFNGGIGVPPMSSPNVPRESHAASPAQLNAAYASSRGVGPSLPLLDVLGWTESDRSRVLSLSAAKRATLIMLKRNALIAAANAIASRRLPAAESAALRARITQLASDPGEDDLIRATAQQVLARPLD